MTDVDAILFDKDGTLFDFHASWSDWTRRLVEELSGGDAQLAATLARSVGYEMETATFQSGSPVVSATPDEIARDLLPHLPGASLPGLVARMNVMAAEIALRPAVPLAPLFSALRRRGLRLGVATNDAEQAARTHLDEAGITHLVDFVAGFDSGHGGKPAPGMLLAFAAAFGFDPARVVMVGDSRHDLIAGRAAGMRTLGVLTGPARESDLAPLADEVMPDIGHIPGWLDRQRAMESVG